MHIFLYLFTFKVEMHCFALNGEQCTFAQEKQNVSQMVISKPLFSIFIHFYSLSASQSDCKNSKALPAENATQTSIFLRRGTGSSAR